MIPYKNITICPITPVVEIDDNVTFTLSPKEKEKRVIKVLMPDSNGSCLLKIIILRVWKA